MFVKQLAIIVARSCVLFTLTVCFDVTQLIKKSDITEEMIRKPEIERLRYFEEIKATQFIKKFNVSGQGVRITTMGELVDALDPPPLNWSTC